MAFSVDLNTFIITIPQTDLSFVSGTLWELDTEAFRLELKDWEDSEEGMAYPDTHTHNTEVTVAGVTYARGIEVSAPYSITFEDTYPSLYAVRLVGSNNNIFDIENGILNQNSVQVIPGNAAGLIVHNILSGSGLSDAQDEKLDDLHKLQGLDSDNPMTVTPSSRDAGAIAQTISGNGTSTSTVTRTA